MQGSSQRGMLPTNLKQIPGVGSEFKKTVREVKDAAPFSIGMWGEMLARKENRVTINKEVKDAWGIPAAHIECSHGDNEKAMAADALTSPITGKDGTILIVLQMAGGNDGLNMVVPYADDAYYRARPRPWPFPHR